MRDMGAEYVRVGEVQVKFPKWGSLTVGQVPDGAQHRGQVRTEWVGKSDFDENVEVYDPVPADQLDEADKATIAQRKQGAAPPMDLLEWYQSKPVPTAAE